MELHDQWIRECYDLPPGRRLRAWFTSIRTETVDNGVDIGIDDVMLASTKCAGECWKKMKVFHIPYLLSILSWWPRFRQYQVNSNIYRICCNVNHFCLLYLVTVQSLNDSWEQFIYDTISKPKFILYIIISDIPKYTTTVAPKTTGKLSLLKFLTVFKLRSKISNIETFSMGSCHKTIQFLAFSCLFCYYKSI